jgi:tetratricopeptide (TPR) repeat protein
MKTKAKFGATLEPQDPPSEQLQRIINFYTQGQLQHALSESSQLLERFPNSVVLYNIAGACNAGLMQFDAAINNYKQALKIKPDYADAYNNMGNALKDKGDSEAAIESYKQALKIKPDYAEVYRNLSNIHRYKEHDEYFLKMQSLCQSSSVSDEQRCHLNFALSKASEDLNEVSQSFNYLKIGNELRKKILSYDIKKDIELFSQLKKSYPSIALQSVVESSDLKPIFILGMPRSGTTLVEQIVSSHSEVTGAGELSYVSRFGDPTARGAIKPNAKMILDFRQRYIEALKKRSDGRSIVTDKMPQNFLYVGLIFSAFPDAKVIHVNRDPAATCWSNYKHYFIDKDLGYCYDLDDTVTYFGLYTDLMQFWLGHYGDRIYNLNYDNLTINQDDETRKLIEYLELEWENDCLSPQHNKRSVRTVSQQQVRQKVYQGSSQQWRKFEPYLNGAFDQLTELN